MHASFQINENRSWLGDWDHSQVWFLEEFKKSWKPGKTPDKKHWVFWEVTSLLTVTEAVDQKNAKNFGFGDEWSHCVPLDSSVLKSELTGWALRHSESSHCLQCQHPISAYQLVHVLVPWFQFSPLLMCLRKQRNVAQGFGPLPPLWKDQDRIPGSLPWSGQALVVVDTRGVNQ